MKKIKPMKKYTEDKSDNSYPSPTKIKPSETLPPPIENTSKPKFNQPLNIYNGSTTDKVKSLKEESNTENTDVMPTYYSSNL